MTELERKCGNCDHCLILSDQQTCECHIQPPGSLVSNKWPLVDKNDWCGEFQPKGKLHDFPKTISYREQIHRLLNIMFYKGYIKNTSFNEIVSILKDDAQSPIDKVAEEKAKAKQVVEKILRDERTKVWKMVDELRSEYTNDITPFDHGRTIGLSVACSLIEMLGINKDVNNG